MSLGEAKIWEVSLVKMTCKAWGLLKKTTEGNFWPMVAVKQSP
jgi:hypothetical protein